MCVAKDVKFQVEFNPAKRHRVPAHRLREPHPEGRGLQGRREGRRRHRQRTHGHGALRDRAGRVKIDLPGVDPLEVPDGLATWQVNRRVADGEDAVQTAGRRREPELAAVLPAIGEGR